MSPFVSEAQRRYMWAKHPKVAREWADKYGTPRNLPERLNESKRKAYKNAGKKAGLTRKKRGYEETRKKRRES